jgi:TRAP-type uncharacterized transport system fused permease subunit
MIAGRYQQTELDQLAFVMAGHSSLPCADYVNLSALPAIHVFFLVVAKNVDARHKAGHDGGNQTKAPALRPGLDLSVWSR